MPYKRQRTRSKELVNPYLFFLAKRLAQCYYFGSKNPSDLAFVKAIYNRYKSAAYGNTTYIDAATRQTKDRNEIVVEEVKLDPFAKGIAKRIHRIVKSHDLFFTKGMLDYLVKEIRVFHSIDKDESFGFDSWDEFVQMFKDDRGTMEAAQLCKGRRYDDLSSSEKREIFDAVEFKCQKLLSRDHQIGPSHSSLLKSNSPIIATTDSYTIRQAHIYQYGDIILMRGQKLDYATQQRLQKIRMLARVNPNIVFQLIDEHGVEGYISLIPLSERWVEELLNKEKIPGSFSKSDILSMDDAHLVKHILIERIEGLTKRAKRLLKFYLPLMLDKLMAGTTQDFSVLYIGTDHEVEGVMQSFGFIDFSKVVGDNIRDIRTVFLANGRVLSDMVSNRVNETVS